jgi:hypothetical protein
LFHEDAGHAFAIQVDQLVLRPIDAVGNVFEAVGSISEPHHQLHLRI